MRATRARPSASKYISGKSSLYNAWHGLGNVHEGRKERSELRSVANHVPDTMCEDSDWTTWSWLKTSVRAHLELGDYETCEIDLEEMAGYEGVSFEKTITKLREEIETRRNLQG